jgi:hypothetical protein
VKAHLLLVLPEPPSKGLRSRSGALSLSLDDAAREEAQAAEERAVARARSSVARASVLQASGGEDLVAEGYTPFVVPPQVPEKASGRGVQRCTQNSLYPSTRWRPVTRWRVCSISCRGRGIVGRH